VRIAGNRELLLFPALYPLLFLFHPPTIAPISIIPISQNPQFTPSRLSGFTSNTYSVLHVVATNPTHNSAPTLIPRSAVCAPVNCVKHEIPAAITAADNSAVPYCTYSFIPLAINHCRVRPIPLSQLSRNTEYHMASNTKQAAAATAIAQ